MTIHHMNSDSLLEAYANGQFPMGDECDRIDWYDPQHRGVFPLDRFHVPGSVRRLLNRQEFQVEVDQRFTEVMLACGSKQAGRYDTWINGPIVEAYSKLHLDGHAHSIEVIRDGKLVGGLYGVRLGSAFFGESMFSYVTGGSKIALVHTAARLSVAGFQLFDAQYYTEHLRQFGCLEISRRSYKRLLKQALNHECEFPRELSDDQLAKFMTN
jgi:leucyl/phenylalanyl-tRNA--protein transferase